MVVATATRAERDVVVANAPVLLMALNAEGVVTMCDGAAAAALGLGAEQVGLSLAELLPDEPALLRAVESASPERGPRQFEIAVRDRVLDTVVEVRGGGTFLIGTDVTDRCAAQGELRRRATEDELTGLPNKAEMCGGWPQPWRTSRSAWSWQMCATSTRERGRRLRGRG